MKEHYNINGYEFDGYDWLHGPCPTNKEICGPAFVQLMQRLYEQWVRFVDSALPGIRKYIDPPEFYKYIYHTKDDGTYYFTLESIGPNPQIYDDPNNSKIKHSPIDGTKFDVQYLYDVRYYLLLLLGSIICLDPESQLFDPPYIFFSPITLINDSYFYDKESLASTLYYPGRQYQSQTLLDFENLYKFLNLQSPNGLDKYGDRNYYYFYRSPFDDPDSLESKKLLDIDYAEIAKSLDIISNTSFKDNKEQWRFPYLIDDQISNTYIEKQYSEHVISNFNEISFYGDLGIQSYYATSPIFDFNGGGSYCRNFNVLNEHFLKTYCLGNKLECIINNSLDIVKTINNPSIDTPKHIYTNFIDETLSKDFGSPDPAIPLYNHDTPYFILGHIHWNIVLPSYMGFLTYDNIPLESFKLYLDFQTSFELTNDMDFYYTCTNEYPGNFSYSIITLVTLGINASNNDCSQTVSYLVNPSTTITRSAIISNMDLCYNGENEVNVANSRFLRIRDIDFDQWIVTNPNPANRFYVGDVPPNSTSTLSKHISCNLHNIINRLELSYA